MTSMDPEEEIADLEETEAGDIEADDIEEKGKRYPLGWSQMCLSYLTLVNWTRW